MGTWHIWRRMASYMVKSFVPIMTAVNFPGRSWCGIHQTGPVLWAGLTWNKTVNHTLAQTTGTTSKHQSVTWPGLYKTLLEFLHIVVWHMSARGHVTRGHMTTLCVNHYLLHFIFPLNNGNTDSFQLSYVYTYSCFCLLAPIHLQFLIMNIHEQYEAKWYKQCHYIKGGLLIMPLFK